MKAVRYANLPERCSLLLLGKAYRKSLGPSLLEKGFQVLYVPDNPLVDPRIRGHADLSVFHAGKDRIFLAPFLEGSTFSDALQTLGFTLSFCRISQKASYPRDCAMNACQAGENLICNPKTVAAEILEASHPEQSVFCNQGYTKCSLAPVDEHSFLCSDPGVARRCRDAGFDVLEIPSACIRLPGFSSGFIGGGCFRASAQTMVFTGRITDAAWERTLLHFLERRNMQAIWLSTESILDVGSILPITEKED